MTLEETDALIVVDAQNDFCPGGALPVEGGGNVVRHLNRMLFKFPHVVAARDWHPHDHCSFDWAPAYTDGSWPAHCVEDTPGAEFPGDLHVPMDAIFVNKGTDPDVEAYSAFAGRGLAEKLRERGVTRVFVAGLGIEYGVRATALDAKAAGFETYLIEDACRGLAAETTEAAMKSMEDAGIRTCRSWDVVE